MKDMYEREYCAVDVCGHEACHQGANTVTHSQQKNVHEVPIPHNSRYQFHVFYTYECTYVCTLLVVYSSFCMYMLYISRLSYARCVPYVPDERER